MLVDQSYSISKVTKLRDLLYDKVGVDYAGLTMEGQTFVGMVDTLKAWLPQAVSYDALFESCRSIVGEAAGKQNLYELSWRLAGNVELLKRGKIVPIYNFQTYDEWVPVQIVQCHPIRNRYDDRGYLFKFRILAGTPSGTVFEKFWSLRYCKFMSRQLGFSFKNRRPPR